MGIKKCIIIGSIQKLPSGISPELHRRLVIYTTAHNIFLNSYIEDTLEKSPAAQAQ
ncbi:MAG TPA: type II toxin-antitoxin system HicB family antitoxin [Candidatus Mediterraneibacter avicola]|nr:type II toxin-antitoxin system HicB family antitoxin [Candidatus Mediterraneibacter avicola]